MTDKELNQYLDFAKELAEEAGKIMKRYFRAADIGTTWKEDNTPLTIADTTINDLIIREVKKKYPTHGVLGEEKSYKPSSDRLWIVDPIDGTSNYSKGIPVAFFSLALVEEGKSKAGVILDPFTDRLFWAAIGKGAYLNGKRLDISKRRITENLVISSYIGGGVHGTFFENPDADERMLAEYRKKGNIHSSVIPVAGSLAMVAGGFLDASVSACRNPWDLAASSLIALESGATVTDIFGEEVLRWDENINGMCVAHPAVHDELLRTIKPVIEGLRSAHYRD